MNSTESHIMKKAITLLSLSMLVALAACSPKAPAPDTSAAPAPAPAPAAAVVTAPAAPVVAVAPASAADLAIGEKIYGATCLACHGSGVMGAPKLGDKALWAPRIGKGVHELYGSAMNGLKLMPARGGNAALKDEELKAAVDYMVSKAL